MAIYRGPGGSGDATTDTTNEATVAAAAAAAAQTSATNAASSASSASTSATSASNSASLATTKATAAASSAASASTSASTASSKAAEATSGAVNAAASAVSAASSASNAAASAANAANASRLTVGTTTTGSAGTNAIVSITGAAGSQVVNFTIPRGSDGIIGADGAPGPANTLTIGTVTGGDSAAATITGTSPNQTLNLTLPKGDTGATGVAGPANTLTIGTVSSGGSASATITGTSPNQTLNLTLPKGDTGPAGPTGAKGDSGDPGLDWKGAYSAGTSYVINDGVSYLGSSYICIAATTGNLPTNTTYWELLAQKGLDGEGAGSVTSVAMTVPTGLSVSGSPITDAGTLAVTYASGYSIPTDTKQGQWDTAYGWGNHASAGYAHSGANSDITSLSGITGGVGTADYYDLDTAATPTGAVGRLSWDDGNGTAQIGLKGGNVTLQLGQELVARVYNDSGVALTDGQIVYISGAQGNRIAVKLAKADSESTSAGTLGMVTEPIAFGAEGFITIMGTVNGLNTSGLTAGQLVYLSSATAGAYTTTAPTAPNHRVTLGYVERVHSTVGSIYIKVDNGYELDELHNVVITTPSSGQVLKYNGTTWVNTAETDPVFVASPAYNITNTNISNWNTAYGWGNHASAGYLTSSAIGTTVQAYDADLDTWATKAAPSGTVVGTSDSQTLTNKTFTGYTETVYNLSGTEINSTNGTIQYKTLSGNTTFTEALANGQSVTLMLNPSTYTVTWPTTTWVGSTTSTAPTLTASVYNCITFFQLDGVFYGKYEGRV